MNRCDRCGADGRTVRAYWGPDLCPPCARYVAAQLDELDRWPPVPWDTDEEVPTDAS